MAGNPYLKNYIFTNFKAIFLYLKTEPTFQCYLDRIKKIEIDRNLNKKPISKKNEYFRGPQKIISAIKNKFVVTFIAIATPKIQVYNNL